MRIINSKLDNHTLSKIYLYLWKLRIKPVFQEYKNIYNMDRSGDVISKKCIPPEYTRAINYRILSRIDNAIFYRNIHNGLLITGRISKKYFFSSGCNNPNAYK